MNEKYPPGHSGKKRQSLQEVTKLPFLGALGIFHHRDSGEGRLIGDGAVAGPRDAIRLGVQLHYGRRLARDVAPGFCKGMYLQTRPEKNSFKGLLI